MCLRFSGAFSKLRKVSITVVMFVWLSVRVEQLGYHWMAFYGVRNLRIFGKSVERNLSFIKT
jgi:hypothetical protein